MPRPPAPPSYQAYRRRQAARPYRARRKANYATAQRPYVMQGKGDYWANRRRYERRAARPGYTPSLGRSVIEGGGQLLGSAFGFGELGKTAGRHLSHLIGLGDYSVKQNLFLSGRLPEMVNLPAGGGTIIRFQEYLGDIISGPSANTFDLSSYIINPANQVTFPWLSQIAANFEQYSFEGLVFEFRSTSANALNSVNTALGTVMMATQYDVADSAFTSKAEMLNYEFSNSIKPSENCLHMIECAPRQSTLTELYTNPTNEVPVNTDPRFYNLGRFCIATSGFQGTNVNIGELHVTYQVRLLKPKLSDALAQSNGYAIFDCASLGGTASFGTSQSSVYNNLGVSFPTGNSLRIPGSAIGSTYLIDITATATASPNATNFTVASPTVSNGVVVWFRQNPAAGAATSMPHWQAIIHTDPNVDIVVTVATTYLSTFPAYVRVIELPREVVD